MSEQPPAPPTPMTLGDLKKQLEAWTVDDTAELRLAADRETSMPVRSLQFVRTTRGVDQIVLDAY